MQRVALDRTLALYPDGFFAQFRNARGEGGAQFLPVSAFHMSFEVIGMSFEAAALAQCPVIRRKLEIMAAAVRAGFDTAGWGVARWEQPLTVQDRAA